MKKFMLRGKEEYAITEYMPKSLKYGVWYHFVTPFDWNVFKLKKGGRYVSVYDDINDTNPLYTITKKRFLNTVLLLAKSPPKEVIGSNDYYRGLVDRKYRK